MLMTERRYQPITLSTIERSPFWSRIPQDLRDGIRVVGQVLPFRVNAYVLEELIDWAAVPDDPMFRLVFPLGEMLSPGDYADMAAALERGNGVRQTAERIRAGLNPHPAGQLSHNVPEIDGRPLRGLQRKYRETILYFPAAGQVCHAYCTFCFRWPQFVGDADLRIQAQGADDLVAFLRRSPEISDVLVTGGDPMVMKASVLARHVEPLLDPALDHVSTIRFGTKALTYWPHRFVTDPDADDLLRLFERIVASGRHVAVMAHVNHPVELSTPAARAAVARIRATGAALRVQAPLLRRINDDAAAWAELWRRATRLGMVPYYMFVERDTGPRHYFEVPLARAAEIFAEAYRGVSGLARTVRGPSMSTLAGKVVVDGTVETGGERRFALRFLQARDPDWVNRPFHAVFDPEATWFDQLRPASPADTRFFPHLPRGATVPAGAVEARPAAAAAD
jgi:KamA family protein